MKFSAISSTVVTALTLAIATGSNTATASPINIKERAVNFNVRRGFAWAADSRWAPRLLKGYFAQDGSTAKGWYWHWEDGPLTELANTNVEYVPNYWGPRYASKWAQRESEMYARGLPKAILAQNEIDVTGQANQNAADAAASWVNNLAKWQDKGVKISSPQIVWNVDLLKQTRNILRNNYGRDFDFVAVHYYGPWYDVQRFKDFILKVHNAFPDKKVWVTEIGVTSESGGSQAQVKGFHSQVFGWLETQSYVKRASIFGFFPITNPPDSYGSRLNALFNGDGSTRDLASWYMWG